MIYQATVPQFSKMLSNMAKVLDKAAATAGERKFDVGVLLRARLAPDQFDFTRQIQVTCDTAKMAVALLTGKEAEMPAHEDSEKTIEELKHRIEKTIAYLNTFSAKDFDESAKRQIFRPRWEGRYLLGEDFLFQHALPNFYFHFTTAYAILRHNGVVIGKRDYLGEMPYQNPAH